MLDDRFLSALRKVAISKLLKLVVGMMMRWWMLPLSGWALCAGVAQVVAMPAEGAASEPAPTNYTKDRLTSERMQELAAPPMKLARRGDIDGATASFARVKARTAAERGGNSLELADLLTSFGIGLYLYGLESDDDRYRMASLPYLHEAIEAYKAALGPRHPEVAVAQYSYADAVQETKAPVPPGQIEAILLDALDIRVATLGEANSETRDTMAGLGDHYASRAKASGDRNALEAEKYYRRGLAVAQRGSSDVPSRSVPEFHIDLAKLYALDLSPERSLKEAKLAEAAAIGLSEPGQCLLYNVKRGQLADALEAHGHQAAAVSLSNKGGLETLLVCAELGKE